MSYKEFKDNYNNNYYAMLDLYKKVEKQNYPEKEEDKEAIINLVEQLNSVVGEIDSLEMTGSLRNEDIERANRSVSEIIDEFHDEIADLDEYANLYKAPRNASNENKLNKKRAEINDRRNGKGTRVVAARNAKEGLLNKAKKVVIPALAFVLGLTFAKGCTNGVTARIGDFFGGEKTSETAEPEATAETTEVPAEELPQQSAEPQLALGEPGTFTDLSSEEQIHARAQYIYDNVYAKFTDYIDDERLSMMFMEHKNHISVEGIENVIRTMNGIPPVNENGEYYVSVNMGDHMLNEAAFYLFGVPSALYDQNCMKVYQSVPSHLFVLDNTEASRFLAGYDEAYEEFCQAINSGDGNKTYEAAQNIACKMYYEWHLDGIFGDQNPYLLNPELLKIARMCSVDKWVNYVYEYEQDAQLAICVDVCVDYVTHEIDTLKGDEIQQAITYDLWTNTVAISAGMEEEVKKSKQEHGMEYENQVFLDYLLNEINYQYETNYKGKTVGDAMSLTKK